MNRWLGSIVEAVRTTPGLLLSMAIVWFLLPFTAQLLLHPDDVIRLQRWLQGEAIPSNFTSQQLVFGAISAAVTLAALVMLLLGLLTVLYHRLRFALVLYPIAGVALGVIGNLWWAHRVGFIDFPGILAGFFPAALTVIWQRAAEGMAQDFVFGRGVRPRFPGLR